MQSVTISIFAVQNGVFCVLLCC